MYASLVWNLFLAWLPLGFALLVREEFQSKKARGWRCWGLAAAWLLFFPNAPYIFTDVVHLTTYFYRHFWVRPGANPFVCRYRLDSWVSLLVPGARSRA